jgi:nucleotide-binding universal stress UspA family protein
MSKNPFKEGKMFKEIKKILFATDLSKECQKAYDYAVSLASSCQGSITLLHVIESPPESIETQVKNLLGEERYEDIMREHEKDTRSILIGKRKESDVIKSALSKMFLDQLENLNGRYLQPDEIIIKHGDIVKEILSTALNREMDLIIISTHKSILAADAAVSKIAKSLMKQTKIPVLIVPPSE